tara:strand:- start:4847 stop:6487 length:1641 start_codon:yes stop_codon:yes gene_type:complete
MNDPLQRKMFRQVGMSKQPMGILASSPELMNAAKGYNLGGLVARDETGTINMPAYGVRRYDLTGKIIPGDPNSGVFQDPDVRGQTPLQVLKQEQEAKNKTVDTSLSEPRPNINDTNKKIIDSSIVKKEENFPNTKNLGFKTTDNSSFKEPLSQKFENQLNQVTEIQKDAVKSLESANTSADQYQMGGKTVEQRINNFTSLVNQKGQEPTLADVKDDAVKLLGFDPDQLDQQYDEDKQASIWLNMMKAGLAVASGESSNALTNIAKGFSFGLDQYGKDIGKLKTELKADRRDAANTMYKLLKDEKSERLAKKTLEIQQEQGLLNIQMKYVGDQKAKAMAAYNMKMDGAKWNVTLVGTLAKMKGDEAARALQKENLDKTFRLGLAKATPKEIVFLRQSGDIKLKPGITEEIPFGGEGYFNQFDVTPTGKKKLADMASNTTTGMNTDFKYEGRNYGATGQVGAVYLPNLDGVSEEKKKTFGIAAARHIKSIEKLNSYERLGAILSFARQQGAKVRIDQLPPDMINDLNEKSGGENSKSLKDIYSDILVR